MNPQKNNKNRKSIDGFIPLNSPKTNSEKRSSSDGSIGDVFSDKPRSKQGVDDFQNRQEGVSTPSSASNVLAPTPSRPVYNQPPSNSKSIYSKKNGERTDSWEKARKRKKKKRIIITVIVVIVAMFGFLVAKGYIDLLKVFGGGGGAAALNENVDPSLLNVEGDGRVNMLLLGRGGVGHEGPNLTDSIVVVSIDPVEKSAGIVSIPRDTYVTVPDYGSMKINSVFNSGKERALIELSSTDKDSNIKAEDEGLKLTEQTVEDVLGIPIHFNAIVDFDGFIEAIDTVGGIDVNVPKAVQEQMRINGQNYFLDVKAGPKHFDGFEALAYSRSRFTSARGDFDRSERQRLMIVGLKEKVLSVGTFSNPAKISQLLSEFGKNIRTNFSLDDVSRIYTLVKDIDGSKVQSIGLADPPNAFLETANIGGLSVVLPVAGQDNFQDVHHYIRNTLRDSFLKQENASVVILNGTDNPELAAEKAKELRSYGYKVTRIGDAPTNNYNKTTLIDTGFRDNKYTKHYLQKRLGTLATNAFPDNAIRVGTNDFVIILGND